MAGPLLYTGLAPWWPLLSDPGDYAEEAAIFADALGRTVRRPLRTLLELGSGGGNTASHLKARYALTLCDLSPAMIDVSRALNPACEHVEGDMRTVRLARTFDAVLVHDAIMYAATEADLRAVIGTAFAHCAPGGAALLVPDDTRETFREGTSHGGHDRGDRGLRYLEWQHAPDPRGTSFVRDYAFLLREGWRVRVERDRHVLGLFPRATWLRLLAEAGFAPATLPFRHSTFPADAGRELFLGVRG